MKVSTTTFALAAALGVAAHPSGFAHKNMHRHIEKRLDFVMNTKPQAPAADVNKAAVLPSPTTTSAPPAAVTSSPPSTSPGSGKKPFCGGNSKRASAADIAFKGNVGTAGNYGCNLMVVDNAAAYDYTTTFENKSGKDQKCVVWLKIGPDNGINGFFNGNQALSFDLPAGGQKVLAAEANSQGGAACGVGSVPLTSFGQFASTWVEFDFANEKNFAYSGADASCLVAADYNLDIPALSVCHNGDCSTVNAGGSGTNAYLKGMNDLDGIGLNIPPGPVALKVTVG
jgi:hypothetical protein